MITRKSKIVAKIADNKSEVEFIKDLFAAGADVAWLNTAHQDEEQTLGVIERIKMVSTEIPILIDTKGPEVRTKNVEVPFEVKPGDHITFTGDLSFTGPNVVQVTYANFHNEIPVGEEILYDDASIELTVQEKLENGIRCLVKNGGLIKSKKSLNVPNVHIHLPALSDKDRSFMHFCAKHNVDFIIHSFVRNKADIFEIKDILKDYPNYKGKIIAKIENREGFDNIEEILDNCEGMMVARGDLGAEVPLEEMAYMQKKMVEAALRKGKYSIVATQVLDSMIKNPRPTRAEVTDAANAVLDGTCAISMSGETAYGDYPMEATKMMARIMSYTEQKRNELVHFTTKPAVGTPEYQAAERFVAEADAANLKAIVVDTENVEIARAISAYRPTSIVLPICKSEEDARELMMGYALRPVVSADQSLKTVIAKIEGTTIAEGEKFMVVTSEGGSYSSKVGTLADFR